MNKLKNTYTLFFFMVNFMLPLVGQYLPKDGAKLNYNQIYFEYPYNPDALGYTLYLAVDSAKNKNDFNHIIHKYNDITPALKVSQLPFGENFKWYIETSLKSGEKQKSDIHYFSTLSCVYADTSKYKTKQYYNKKEKYIDGLLWCDHLHSAVDRKGKIVWFIPAINKDFEEGRQIRDFRFHNDGSITFLSEPEAYHTDKDLNILWKGPNSGKIAEAKNEFYHHSFEKLENGNYLILGNDFVELERTDSKDTATRKVELATLIEYNPKGEIVWFWRMRDCFPFDLLASEKENTVLNPHCNSVSVDKTNKYIYLGFRDISRIIKIEKASKKIVASYGEKLNETDTTVTETSIFRKPHNAIILPNNQILLLNNNDLKSKEALSSSEIFSLPDEKNKKFKSIWSFKFNFDTVTNGRSMKLGGNKILENGNVLINEGVINRVVEITKTKEVLWDLMIFKKESGVWSNFPQYRVNFSRSLYPYLFTCGIQHKTESALKLIIFNEGDYEDEYTCNLYDGNDKLISTMSSGIIKSQSQKTATIPLKDQIAKKLKILSSKSGIIKEIKLN